MTALCRPQGGFAEDDDTTRGPPLQDSELPAIRDTLARWHTPSDFRAAVRTLHRRSASKVIFNNPRYKFLLDAWPLAEFAVRFRNTEAVRLSPPNDPWPDGHVRVEGIVRSVEVTMALMPDRKMGDEYKFEMGARLDPVENWIARAKAIPYALDNAIRRKIAKRYGSSFWLVVYLNIGEYGIRQREIELIIGRAKKRYAAAFGGLFVLWKERLY